MPEDQHQPMGIVIELPEYLRNTDLRYSKPKTVDRGTEERDSVTIIDGEGDPNVVVCTSGETAMTVIL